MVSVKDGRINDQGSAADVFGHDEALKAEESKDQAELQKAEEVEAIEGDTIPAGEKKSGKLIVAEEIDEGHIGWPACSSFFLFTLDRSLNWIYIVKLYFASLGGDYVFFFFIVVLGGFLLSEACNVSQTWWIGHWASKYEEADNPLDVSVS